MVDHGHGGRSRRDAPRGLAAALRREARAERPAFSTSLHGRVLDAVAASRTPRERDRRRGSRGRAAVLGGLAAAAACAAVAVGAAWVRPVADGPDPAAVAAVPGIERLPTLDEIGEGVLAEVTTIAAAAVGMPEWADLAAFDPAAFAAADGAER